MSEQNQVDPIIVAAARYIQIMKLMNVKTEELALVEARFAELTQPKAEEPKVE